VALPPSAGSTCRAWPQRAAGSARPAVL